MSITPLPAPWFAVFEGRLFLLFLACLLSLLLGGPRSMHRLLGLDRPAAWWRGALVTLGTRLNKSRRSAATRRFRGWMLTLFALGLSAALALAVSGLSRPEGWTRMHRGNLASQWFFVVEVTLLATLLPMRQIGERLAEVRRRLARQDVEGARRAVHETAGCDVTGLDRHGIARIAIEAMAKDISARVIGPALWYVLLGLPGAFMVAAVNLLDRAFGHRARQKAAFGLAPALLEDVLQFLPSRLACLLLLLAACFSAGARPRGGWRQATRHAPSGEDVPLPVACVAGCLGITLGGPRHIGDEPHALPWIGDGSARLEIADVKRAQLLYAVAVALFVLAIIAANL